MVVQQVKGLFSNSDYLDKLDTLTTNQIVYLSTLEEHDLQNLGQLKCDDSISKKEYQDLKNILTLIKNDHNKATHTKSYPLTFAEIEDIALQEFKKGKFRGWTSREVALHYKRSGYNLSNTVMNQLINNWETSIAPVIDEETNTRTREVLTSNINEEAFERYTENLFNVYCNNKDELEGFKCFIVNFKRSLLGESETYSTMLTLTSQQGVGKSALVTQLNQAIENLLGYSGETFDASSLAAQLNSRFNRIGLTRGLIILDDITTLNESTAATIKRMITNQGKITVEVKGSNNFIKKDKKNYALACTINQDALSLLTKIDPYTRRLSPLTMIKPRRLFRSVDILADVWEAILIVAPYKGWETRCRKVAERSSSTTKKNNDSYILDYLVDVYNRGLLADLTNNTRAIRKMSEDLAFAASNDQKNSSLAWSIEQYIRNHKEYFSYYSNNTVRATKAFRDLVEEAASKRVSDDYDDIPILEEYYDTTYDLEYEDIINDGKDPLIPDDDSDVEVDEHFNYLSKKTFTDTPHKYNKEDLLVVPNKPTLETMNDEHVSVCDKQDYLRGDNFVFECDNISLDEQKKIINRLPCKESVEVVTFSGNKSYHTLINTNFEEVVKEDKTQAYRYIWNELNRDLFNEKADKASATRSHLMRNPNAIRDNGNKQSCKYYNPNTTPLDVSIYYNEYLKDKQFKNFSYCINTNTFEGSISYAEKVDHDIEKIRDIKQSKNPAALEAMIKLLDYECEWSEALRGISYARECGFNREDIEDHINWGNWNKNTILGKAFK